MTNLVIFDMDGTLVDAFRDIQAAVNAMLAQRGHPGHDLATIRGFVGNGVVRLVERSLPPAELPHLDQAVAFVRAYYEQHPADHAVLYPGAEECLAQLRAAGCKQAILSNKPHEITALVAKRLRLDTMVDAIVGEKRDRPIKPDPAGVHELQRQFAADRVTVVGDGLPDAQVARNAGASFIGVDWGISTRQMLKPFGPVVSSLHDVANLVIEVDSHP
jgi:phosphoglycolate phosphatase